jgi:hypothetical protein
VGREFEFDGSVVPADASRADVRIPDFENSLAVPVDDGPELAEQVSTNSTGEPTRLELPCAMTGCIKKSGDEAHFTFAAKKGEKFLFEVQSASLGFALDARLRIEDAKGKELAKADDSVGADPVLEWTAPEDGTFVAAVANVLHRGGPDHLYRLSMRRPVPSVKATVAANAFTIELGKTNEIKLTVKRLHGLQSKLTIGAKGLPDEVRVEPTEVPEKSGDVALKLIASADAHPFSRPIQLVVTDADSAKEHRVVHELITTGINNGVPNGFNKLVIESTDQLWLTVLSAPTAKAKTE